MKNILDGIPTGSATPGDDEDLPPPPMGWRNGWWVGLVILLWGALGFAAAIAATLD
jgi:hypothetical protein